MHMRRMCLPANIRWACGAGEVPASEKELRGQLRELQAERDALLKDVEALCMQACPCGRAQLHGALLVSMDLARASSNAKSQLLPSRRFGRASLRPCSEHDCSKSRSKRFARLTWCSLLLPQGDVGTIFDKSSLLSERIIAADRCLALAARRA